MSRGLGKVQQAVLEVVYANPEGLATDTIASKLFGRKVTRAELESVRRAIRTLDAGGLVRRTTRWDSRPRRSIRRLTDLAACEQEFCDLCAQRKRRVRLNDWHRRAIRANAEHDPAWLTDLAVAENSGFVHSTASRERVIVEKPNAVDQCQRRVQFVLPRSRSDRGR